jgi:hypothetical protein
MNKHFKFNKNNRLTKNNHRKVNKIILSIILDNKI